MCFVCEIYTNKFYYRYNPSHLPFENGKDFDGDPMKFFQIIEICSWVDDEIFQNFYHKYKNDPRIKYIILNPCMSSVKSPSSTFPRFEHLERLEIVTCNCGIQSPHMRCGDNCSVYDMYNFCMCRNNTHIRLIENMPKLQFAELVYKDLNRQRVFWKELRPSSTPMGDASRRSEPVLYGQYDNIDPHDIDDPHYNADLAHSDFLLLPDIAPNVNLNLNSCIYRRIGSSNSRLPPISGLMVCTCENSGSCIYCLRQKDM
jgi:hypothetical protein